MKKFSLLGLRKDFSLNKIEILRALIWINMSPLHHHPFDSFLFYFGKYNLFKSLNEKKLKILFSMLMAF